jgi:hypothetical protein
VRAPGLPARRLVSWPTHAGGWRQPGRRKGLAPEEQQRRAPPAIDVVNEKRAAAFWTKAVELVDLALPIAVLLAGDARGPSHSRTARRCGRFERPRGRIGCVCPSSNAFWQT